MLICFDFVFRNYKTIFIVFNHLLHLKIVRGPATAQTLPGTSRPEQRPEDQVQYSTIVQQQEQQQQMAQQFSRQASLPRNTLLQRKASGIDLNEVVPSRKTGTSGSLR